MSILRNTTNRENFLIVSKIFLQDTTLSINERGLLASMHSLPDNWEFSIAGMMKILPADLPLADFPLADFPSTVLKVSVFRLSQEYFLQNIRKNFSFV